ncbi:MAG: hypothetical protein Q4C87_10145 [Actinomycetaceae bacterium]|nr:hypothetical protein [Actinomycetaceae bacterium]
MCTPTTPLIPLMSYPLRPGDEGLYGPQGWTVDRGIPDLLAPYIPSSPPWGDFIRFSHLDGEAAAALLEIMPTQCLAVDSQNTAPPLGDLLRIATSTTGVTLDGYLISAPRIDERVSVDALSLPDPAAEQALNSRLSSYALLQEWTQIAPLIGIDPLEATRYEPDELLPIARCPGTGKPGWWIWWD